MQLGVSPQPFPWCFCLGCFFFKIASYFLVQPAGEQEQELQALQDAVTETQGIAYATAVQTGKSVSQNTKQQYPALTVRLTSAPACAVRKVRALCGDF